MSVNKVIILGRLGQNPELRYTASGTAVCRFSVATSDFYDDKQGERQEQTEWHRITVWGKQGENCNKFLEKGKQVYLEGRLRTSSWTDKSGQKRYSTEVVARSVKFIGSKFEKRTQDGQGLPQDGQRDQDRSNNESPPEGILNKDYQVSTNENFTADDIPF